MKDDKPNKTNVTNVMRLLDKNKIPYSSRTYMPNPAMTGEDIAVLLNEEPSHVFKTLVTQGRSNSYYVFVVPVNQELDLKKAAKVANEKSIAMIKQKELLPLTGYIHGGCSPVGLKKAFPVFIDETAILFDTFFISGGKVGLTLELNAEALAAAIGAQFADLTQD